MKQTAVEWLAEQIKEYDFSPRDNTYLIEIPSWILKERIEQAKEMEKQQERDACGLALSKLLYKQALKSEISDNDIEKASYTFWEFTEHTASSAWKLGAKWYREQLKK